MRRSTTAGCMVALGLGLVACGAGQASSVPTAPTPQSTVDVESVGSTAPDTTTSSSTSSVPVTVAPDTNPPDTNAPGTTVPGRAPENRPLSVTDALLPPESFPPPWEHQSTRTDPIEYDVGPNQSDCEPYWRYNAIQGSHEAHTSWWIDGGNANQWVSRLPAPEAAALVAEIDTVPDVCPTVSWSEGDFFTVQRLELGPDIVGFEMVTQPGRDREWVAVTSHGDLVSTLWVPLWPSLDDEEFIDMSVEQFATIARSMRALLLAAGPAEPSELAPPTTQVVEQPAPPGRPPPTPTTNPSVPELAPPQLTPPIVEPVTVPDDPTGLAGRLITPDDLTSTGIGAGWRFVDIERYESSNDGSSTESCPGLASADRIDELLTWSAEIDGDDSFGVRQLLGEADTVERAAQLVTEFAAIADCDLSDLLDGAQLIFKPIAIDGARIAYVEIVVEGSDERDGTLVLAAGRFVTVLTVDVPTDRLDDYDELLQRVAGLAAGRLRP